MFITLYSSVTTHSWQMLANKWLTNPTDYWCARPQHLAGLDPEAWVNASAPRGPDGELDRCRVFDVDFPLNVGADALERPGEDAPTRNCTEFEYDRSEFQVGGAGNVITKGVQQKNDG